MINLLYLPLLLIHLNASPMYTYTWERYGLQFQSSLAMNEMSDVEYWDVDDDELDFWVEVQRIPFDSVQPPFVWENVKKGTHVLADSLGYETVKDGGQLIHVPEGHFVMLKDDGTKSYFAMIIDRPNKVIYTVLIEDMLERKSNMLEVINSLRMVPR